MIGLCKNGISQYSSVPGVAYYALLLSFRGYAGKKSFLLIQIPLGAIGLKACSESFHLCWVSYITILHGKGVSHSIISDKIELSRHVKLLCYNKNSNLLPNIRPMMIAPLHENHIYTSSFQAFNITVTTTWFILPLHQYNWNGWQSCEIIVASVTVGASPDLEEFA